MGSLSIYLLAPDLLELDSLEMDFQELALEIWHRNALVIVVR